MWAFTSENKRRDLPSDGSRVDGSLPGNLHAFSFLLVTLMRCFCAESQPDHAEDACSLQTNQRLFQRKAAHPALNVRTVGDLACIADSRARHTFDPHCLTICPLLWTHYQQARAYLLFSLWAPTPGYAFVLGHCQV